MDDTINGERVRCINVRFNPKTSLGEVRFIGEDPELQHDERTRMTMVMPTDEANTYQVGRSYWVAVSHVHPDEE